MPTATAGNVSSVPTCPWACRHGSAPAGTDYRLLLPDWRGAVIGWLALVAVANVYMSFYARLRVDIRSERLDVARKEQQTDAAMLRNEVKDWNINAAGPMLEHQSSSAGPIEAPGAKALLENKADTPKGTMSADEAVQGW